MIHRGALVPVPGGFEVFLRALEPKELDLAAPEAAGSLTTRQRQALAHEIAHTLYYKDSGGVPSPTGEIKSTRALEELCDRTGWRLLIPTGLLKAEIKNALGDPSRIDANFIRTMKDKFRASFEVTLERVRVTASENGFLRCILVVRASDSGVKITSCYYGLRILSFVPEPKVNTPLSEWLPEFPPSAIKRESSGRWEIARRGRTIVVEKFPLGRRGDFLMQVDGVDRMT